MRPRTAIAAVLLGLCACALGFAQTAPGRRVAESIGISAPSDPFTELYFTRPAELGGSAAGRDAISSRQTVSFAIQSHERTGMRYAWTIETSTGRRLAAGTEVVGAGGSVAIRRSLRVCPSHPGAGTGTRVHRAAHDTRVQVRVILANPTESISYWTGCHV